MLRKKQYIHVNGLAVLKLHYEAHDPNMNQSPQDDLPQTLWAVSEKPDPCHWTVNIQIREKFPVLSNGKNQPACFGLHSSSSVYSTSQRGLVIVFHQPWL